MQTQTQSGPSGSGTSFRPLQTKKTYNVKVSKATVTHHPNGKTELSKVEQMFIDITDETANVHYINNLVREKWGSSYVTVTSDGLPVEDSSGTQGLSFCVYIMVPLLYIHVSSRFSFIATLVFLCDCVLLRVS